MSRRVLIIDDDLATVSAARRSLKAVGYQPMVAASRADAEAALEDGIVDLVVMSLGVEDGSGLDRFEELRRRPDMLVLPVLLIGDGTGNVCDEDSAVEYGADGYAGSPVDWKALAEGLGSYFGEGDQDTAQEEHDLGFSLGGHDDLQSGVAAQAGAAGKSGDWGAKVLEADWRTVKCSTPKENRLGGGWGSQGLDGEIELAAQEQEGFSPRAGRLPDVVDEEVGRTVVSVGGAGREATERDPIEDTALEDPSMEDTVLEDPSMENELDTSVEDETDFGDLMLGEDEDVPSKTMTGEEQASPVGAAEPQGASESMAEDETDFGDLFSDEEYVEAGDSPEERVASPKPGEVGVPSRVGQAPSMPAMPPEGDLSNMDVPHLLAKAWRCRATGALQLESPAGRRQVHFENGRPVAFMTEVGEEQLYEVALRLGIVTPEQAEKVAGGSRSAREQAGKLVELGAMKPGEVFDTVRAAAHAALFGAFSDQAGSWVWSEGEKCPAELRVELPEHPYALIAEGVRRKLSLDAVSSRLGGPSAILETSEDMELELLELGSRERRLAKKIDGNTKAGDLVFESGLGEEGTYQTLYSLVASGQAVVREHDSATQGRRPANDERLADVAIDRNRALEKFKQVLGGNHFEILGVHPRATSYEVHVAYDRLSRLFGWDTYGSDEFKDLWDKVEEIRAALDDARDVIGSDSSRADYLEELRARKTGL